MIPHGADPVWQPVFVHQRNGLLLGVGYARPWAFGFSAVPTVFRSERELAWPR